ncbi:MAG: AAA family ATPase [Candidatus Wildermuthbacteria bacterium]|nr:AAA family ATPase [Candidatus Wildermuthbacteria bacterium]
MLILVCGLPGSGKTRVAREISEKMKISLFRTDEIRKKLFKKPKYTSYEKWLVYQVMFLLAEAFLENKMSVILDATFPWRSARMRAIKIAERYKTSFRIIEVKCPEEILLKRIARRFKKGGLSDADENIYFKIKKEFEPISDKHPVIDTSGDFEETKAQILKIIRDF